jgi:uncharacterized membrane protein YoaK (UPF0700 family)
MAFRAWARDALGIAASLAFIAGFADASSYVGADGIFCAHVTGNFVVLAADLARHAHASEWLKLATFPIFVSAVLSATGFFRSASEPGPASTRQLLVIESTLFALAAALGIAWPSDGPSFVKPAVVALLVLAMGIQNAMHRLNPALGPMTTVMTGNVTGWLVELLRPGPPANAPKHRILGAAIVAFACGCISGALSIARFGFGALVVPLAFALFARTRVAEHVAPLARTESAKP